MKCPFCGFEESKVIDSRPTDEGEKIRRRRECIKCAKRFTTYDTIEKAVSEIETTLQNSLDREVTSVHIGELVMDKLKGIDQVAYVRFASVYKQFKDVNAFMEELSNFLDKK